MAFKVAYYTCTRYLSVVYYSFIKYIMYLSNNILISTKNANVLIVLYI